MKGVSQMVETFSSDYAAPYRGYNRCGSTYSTASSALTHFCAADAVIARALMRSILLALARQS